MARKLGPAQPRGTTWNGAGGWVIVSQSRQATFSRTVWMTFHDLRNHLQRLGYVLAQLRQARAATGRARARRGNDDALARQVLGERLPDGPLALERGNARRLGGGGFGRKIVLAGVGLQILEL